MSETTIQLPRDAAKVMLLFAAKTDIRYYLCGVRIEATNEATRMIATNGHILGIHHSAQQNSVPEPTAVTVPRRVIEMLATKAKAHKRGDNIGLSLMRDSAGDWSIQDHFTKLSIGFKDLQGTGQYPDYMKVIPKTVSGVAGNFNPEYVGVMSKVLRAFGHRYGLCFGQNGNSGALVNIVGVPEFVAVVMPLREDHTASYPAWLDAVPMKAPAKTEAVAA